MTLLRGPWVPNNLKKLKVFFRFFEQCVCVCVFVISDLLCSILGHLSKLWDSLGPLGANRQFCLGHFWAKTGPKMDQNGNQEPQKTNTLIYQKPSNTYSFSKLFEPKASPRASRWLQRWLEMPPEMEPSTNHEIGNFDFSFSFLGSHLEPSEEPS